ncbi:MAG: hypothetical protein KM310_03550 [Clostridiales bacterium]|nr:hypothetical protein [Clostridiales bacterium]
MRRKAIVGAVLLVLLVGAGASATALEGLSPKPPQGMELLSGEEPVALAEEASFDGHGGILPKEKILEAVNLPPEQKEAYLTTWRDYEGEGASGTSPLESPDRLVWVLKAKAPEYHHHRLGVLKDAVVTLVFDAYTGELLTEKVTGVPERNPMARPGR